MMPPKQSPAQHRWAKWMNYLRKNWRLALTFTGIGAAAAALVSCEGPARVAGVPVHFTSHQLCSATFVGGPGPHRILQ